jgi:BCD family chlorophyll transporter-like MFS transporter
MSRSQLLRLGLFQLSAGAISVIFLGVVNRVMRVEFGLDLFLVSLLVGGGHYLGALVAIPFGHYSDTHTLGGLRRTWYAFGGATATALLLAGAPFVVAQIAAHPNALGYGLGFAFFLLEGLSTYVAGTAYLSLIADRTTDATRGPATGVVWTMLMVGIIATGISTGVVLKTYTFDGFVLLTGIGALGAVGLSASALFGQEMKPTALQRPAHDTPSLRTALALLAQSPQARWFAAFLTLGLFSFFMQDVILEPFGGEVFGLTAAETTRFNAYLGVGVIGGMLAGGLWLIPRVGKTRVTHWGCWLMGAAFALLVVTSLSLQARLLPLALVALGLGSGFFTVGGVSLMMDMTSTTHTGLFVGTWTLIQAIAKGPAAIAGGAIHGVLVGLGASPAQAYAGVFALEAVGVGLAVCVLSRVGVQTFQREVASFGELATHALEG